MFCSVFGLPLINNKLLADDFAASGVAVYMRTLISHPPTFPPHAR